MKKIIVITLLLLIGISSCYEDYLQDFEYDSICFPYQTDIRTLVVGEGMQIKIGTNLGGVRTNERDRFVSFILDDALITPKILETMRGGLSYMTKALSSVTTLLPLPTAYYQLSNNSEMVIEKGQHTGFITLTADSALFLADTATIQPNYAIGLYITEADADSIIELKRYTVIGLKYENMLFGNYWHGGVTTVKDAAGNTIQTIRYPTTIPIPESKIWTLTTVAPNALVSNGYSDQTTGNNELKLTLNGNDITISSAPGSQFTYEPDGSSTFNRAILLQERKIMLNYKYINSEGNTCYAQDTLTFRNRIRDGINEWQDENPSHYE